MTNKELNTEVEYLPDVLVPGHEPSETAQVNYGDYAVISSKAMSFLAEILNRSDLSHVLKMSLVTGGYYNALYNGKNFHSNSTLQKYLKVQSKSMFIKLINRLMKAGVLYQMKGRIMGEVRVIYLMNPNLCKKRKNFAKATLKAFEDFSEEFSLTDSSKK